MAGKVTGGLNVGVAQARARSAARAALQAAAGHVLDVSNGRVPVDSGALRRSGRARARSTESAEVSYSDPIAIIQHERMDYHHDKGQAKFLESALASERGEVARILASHLRRALGG